MIKKIKKKFSLRALSLIFLFLSSCKTHPGAVNSDYTVPIANLNNPNASPDAAQSYLHRPGSVAISGRLYLKLDISKLLTNTEVGLFQKNDDKWVMLSSTDTDHQGYFQFTRKIYPGDYELRVMNKKYKGVLALKITDKPAYDLIYEVSSTKKNK